jgi:AbiV family abortive infection protein
MERTKAKKKTIQDKQHLSAEELRNAGIKALQNAAELVEEAQLLFQHGHLSRAVFLCCISGEELGKCFISLSAVMNRRAGVFDEKRYKKRFRTHLEKTAILDFFENVFVSSSDIPIEPSKIDDNAQAVEKFKLASLYCDFYDDKPHAPSELVSETLASKLLELSKKRVRHFTEHVRPKFDQALRVDPAQILRFQREFLQAMSTDKDC